ncbi:MAG TPA: DNA-processing protein DprA [Vicinamibacterales bacterium]|nr:DNA-processing protein DprA [Vicinamibacterales bacterium]
MDLQSTVALTTLSGISRARAAAVFKDLQDHPGGRPVSLERVIARCAPGLDAAANAAAARKRAAGLLEAARQAGIAVVGLEDPRYPPLLRAIVDPPPVLWARGMLQALPRPGIAIVGSRAATPYAREAAARLAEDLARRGLVVVSGLARGVDGAAHRGCLQGEGATIAVLGSGPDVIYPAEHQSLAVSICEHGVIASELGPGAAPLPEHFPARNRLISGISLAVVVVEASEKSGSLITARCALEQGRDVMAVPGSILSGRNRGSHALLKDGAKVVESADDIMEELGWTGLGAERAEAPSNLLISDPLLDKMAAGEPYGIDALASLTGLAGRDLLARLTDWELRGDLERLTGGRFRRPAASTPTGRKPLG